MLDVFQTTLSSYEFAIFLSKLSGALLITTRSTDIPLLFTLHFLLYR